MDNLLFESVKKYIEENFEEEKSSKEEVGIRFSKPLMPDIDLSITNNGNKLIENYFRQKETILCDSLPFEIKLEKTFGEKLIEIIDKKGLKDAYVYKAAYVSRQLFNNIKNKKGYNPSKDIAIALIFPLELPYEESIDLLSSAGYSLTKSSKFDIIIDYCFKNKIYNLGEVNNILSAFEERELGPS